MSKKELPDLNTYEFEEVAFDRLMQNRINKVLIVCSNYDFYMLEEDGRIDERIFNEYMSLNLRYPPSFLHANSAKRASIMLASDKIDLVITWLDIGNYKAFETSKKIKNNFSTITKVCGLFFYKEKIIHQIFSHNPIPTLILFHRLSLLRLPTPKGSLHNLLW